MGKPEYMKRLKPMTEISAPVSGMAIIEEENPSFVLRFTDNCEEDDPMEHKRTDSAVIPAEVLAVVEDEVLRHNEE